MYIANSKSYNCKVKKKLKNVFTITNVKNSIFRELLVNILIIILQTKIT